MIRHNVKSTIHELNILDYDSHEKFLNSLPELPTVVLSAIGLLDNRNESVGNINKTVLRSDDPSTAIFSLVFKYFYSVK